MNIKEMIKMADFYPFKIKNRELGRLRFWLKVTKWLHQRGWFRLSKITAGFIK